MLFFLDYVRRGSIIDYAKITSAYRCYYGIA